MMTTSELKKHRGFTLIELLIVIGMLAVVMSAIYSLYLSHQRAAYTSDEVVEVQQNLRIAMDSITRDVEIAGFMIPASMTPLQAATATSLTINVATASGIAARLDSNRTGLGEFVVDSEESVDPFSLNDSVRIIRPQDRGQPGGAANLFRVAAMNRTARTITLAVATGADIGTLYTKGDIIVRTASGAPHPNTVQYCLGPGALCGAASAVCPAGQTCLFRVENGTANALASNISPGGLQFSYLLDNGAEVAAPTPDQMWDVRAVRLTITGQTETTVHLSGNQPKVRQMTTLAKIRNRIGD